MNYVRGDLRDQLAHVGRAVTQAGLVLASGGNLSAREPGSDLIWVTAAGSWLDRLDETCFARVRMPDGSVVDSGYPLPSTELALHLATYQTRLDVNAVLHLHPQSLVLLDAADERVRLITTDHAYYVRRVARTRFAAPGSSELARAAAAAVADGTNCVVLAHHGCSVLGESIEMAHRRVVNLEEAARLSLRALMLARVGSGVAIPECPVAATGGPALI